MSPVTIHTRRLRCIFCTLFVLWYPVVVESKSVAILFTATVDTASTVSQDDLTSPLPALSDVDASIRVVPSFLQASEVLNFLEVARESANSSCNYNNDYPIDIIHNDNYTCSDHSHYDINKIKNIKESNEDDNDKTRISHPINISGGLYSRIRQHLLANNNSLKWTGQCKVSSNTFDYAEADKFASMNRTSSKHLSDDYCMVESSTTVESPSSLQLPNLESSWFTASTLELVDGAIAARQDTNTSSLNTVELGARNTYLTKLLRTTEHHVDRYTQTYKTFAQGEVVNEKVGFVFLGAHDVDDSRNEKANGDYNEHFMNNRERGNSSTCIEVQSFTDSIDDDMKSKRNDCRSLKDNKANYFVHGDAKVILTPGSLIVFDGNVEHHTEVLNGKAVWLLGPFTIVENNLSIVGTGTASQRPSALPSISPSSSPTSSPSSSPSTSPSASPSLFPTTSPSNTPSATPSIIPSQTPSSSPSIPPSITPSVLPSTNPSKFPSPSPSFSPSVTPSAIPSFAPTFSPTISPAPSTSVAPSLRPSNSFEPSTSPTAEAVGSKKSKGGKGNKAGKASKAGKIIKKKGGDQRKKDREKRRKKLFDVKKKSVPKGTRTKNAANRRHRTKPTPSPSVSMQPSIFVLKHAEVNRTNNISEFDVLTNIADQNTTNTSISIKLNEANPDSNTSTQIGQNITNTGRISATNFSWTTIFQNNTTKSNGTKVGDKNTQQYQTDFSPTIPEPKLSVDEVDQSSNVTNSASNILNGILSSAFTDHGSVEKQSESTGYRKRNKVKVKSQKTVSQDRTSSSSGILGASYMQQSTNNNLDQITKRKRTGTKQG